MLLPSFWQSLVKVRGDGDDGANCTWTMYEVHPFPALPDVVSEDLFRLMQLYASLFLRSKFP
jgi:hypothetical protein